MPNIPSDWKTLNVVTDLGITRTDGSLFIYRTQKGSTKVYARWLPEEEDDPRPRSYDKHGRLKKRIPYSASMGTHDPMEGGRLAVQWLKQLKKDLVAQMGQKDYDQQHSVQKYWEDWWKVERARLENKQTGDSRIRDREQLWTAPDWGLGSQEWTKKSIYKVNYQDLVSYWEVLDRRATPTNDMKGTKEGQRTLLNKVFKRAMATDMPELRLPTYPEIKQSVSKPPVRHLHKQHWEEFLKCIVDLSGGAALQKLTKQEYWDLEFKPHTRKNQRNWVDLHDTVLMLWFFHLRETDPHVVTTEMFEAVPGEEPGSVQKWQVKLQSDKNQRDIITTTHYRDAAILYMERVKARKPSGFLCLPYMPRPDRSPKQSKVCEKVTDLIKDVLREIGVDPKGFALTQIRHTAFRLTLEERRELGTAAEIDAFARNGHTSKEMLWNHYLRYLDIDESTRKHRITESSKWGMVKRVSMDGI